MIKLFLIAGQEFSQVVCLDLEVQKLVHFLHASLFVVENSISKATDEFEEPIIHVSWLA